MHERKQKGLLAEAKAIFELTKQGYEVFLPYGDCASCDLIALRDGKLSRVSVKYVSYAPDGSFLVELRNISRRNHGEIAIKKFDSSAVDMVIVYIQPEDRVEFLDPKLIAGKSCLSIRRRVNQPGAGAAC